MEPVGVPSPVIDVDRLATEVRQWASSQQLVVVPATPVPGQGGGYLVLLDHRDLSATEFCELAACAGAKLLYLQAEWFDPGTDPDTAFVGYGRTGDSRPVTDQLVQFRRDMERFNGRIRQLELAFATESVLHCWAVAADWYLNLVDRAAELFPPKEACS
jgi:hypothetical protein